MGACVVLAATTAVLVASVREGAAPRGGASPGPAHFLTADRCMPCHNSVTTAAGIDASIGFDWRASIMANSARDPYWQAGVRREVLDHRPASAEIQDECSTCHMPMQRFAEHAALRQGRVFDREPALRGTELLDSLSADGVSCTLCHQIRRDRLGDTSSFVGGFVIDTTSPVERRAIYGPYAVDRGHTMVMHTSSGFVPTQSEHIESSELCATCHTLYTPTLDSAGRRTGSRFPEQMASLEWRHSAYRNERSCQDCHMAPVVPRGDSVPITSVNGPARTGVRRHWFPGGNFFMIALLNRYRNELAVEATPPELDAAGARTHELLAQAATLAVAPRGNEWGRLMFDVTVTNLTGHKLPTAYPSRRAWLHVVVRDRAGATVFESGAFLPSGQIVGNANDEDRTTYEPHYREITRPDQVQIYEAIMEDAYGAVTTGVLSATRYVKDNRILPRGFDKASADSDIAVRGDAAQDPAFGAGAHRTRYRIDVGRTSAPYRVTAELWYQPIGYRWAQNLRLQPSFETDRFVRYYEAMAPASATVLARDSIVVP